MKRIYNQIVLVVMLSAAMVACNTDIEKITLDNPADARASVLTLEGQSEVVPDNDNLTDFAAVFNWTRTLLGDPVVPVTYTLLVDTTDQFTSPIKVAVGTNSLSRTVTYSQINEWGLEFSPNLNNIEPLDLFVQIAGSVLSQNSQLTVPTDSVYSNYLTINVTPFIADPATIYLPGNYAVNAWDIANSPKLYSKLRDDVYMGYVYLNTEFKIALTTSWDDSYGGAGGIIEGADNIQTSPGFYWVEVDMKAKTYGLTPVEFSVIGSIKGNWETDYPMTYDVNRNRLSVTQDFSAGEFKIRRDRNWDFSFGLDPEGNLTSDNGANIPLELGGQLTISLDLSNYLEPVYSVAAAAK